MTVTSPFVPDSGVIDEVTAIAAVHQQSQAAVRLATVAAVIAEWSQIDPTHILAQWAQGLGERLYVLVSMAQETLASESAAYVRTVLAAQGIVAQLPLINPLSFAGRAADGRNLEDLLRIAAYRTNVALDRGETEGMAIQRGAQFLKMAVSTEISDAGRAADQVSMVVAQPPLERRAATVGWVRMLQPPSCSRCVVLAGRFYRWNQGFERHEMCDCRHVPAVEAIAGDLLVDPQAYFDSLSRTERAQLFGVAVSDAIEAGGDIAQVVNAATRANSLRIVGGRRYTTEGTTRRGRARGQQRPTPWQIIQDAAGDRDEARRLLQQFGYIVA